MVIELLDARMPRASENPMLKRLRRELPCLKLLTKSDLADPAVTKEWKAALRSERVMAEEVVSTERKLVSQISKLSQQLVPGRGHPGFPVRAMIVGVPNVGKSTLFNTLLGARKAEVKNKPAVTRREQHAQVSEQLLIVDTPGVLWPKLENQRAAYCLAAAGSVGDAAYDPIPVAIFVLELLRERYATAMKQRFKLATLELVGQELLEAVGQRRGCLVKGGEVDMRKAAAAVLSELRNGQIARISFERPSDYHEEPPHEDS